MGGLHISQYSLHSGLGQKSRTLAGRQRGLLVDLNTHLVTMVTRFEGYRDLSPFAMCIRLVTAILSLCIFRCRSFNKLLPLLLLLLLTFMVPSVGAYKNRKFPKYGSHIALSQHLQRYVLKSVNISHRVTGKKIRLPQAPCASRHCFAERRTPYEMWQ